MIQDLRYAMRALRRSPSFAASAILTLAIGIAVNTIVFTLLNSLGLRTMPVRDATRVVRLYPVDSRGHRQNLFSYPDYLDYKAAASQFDGVTAYIPASVTARVGTADAEDLLSYVVAPDYFTLLGIEPSAGRTFLPADERGEDPALAMISYSFWRRRFGSAPSAIGSSIVLNDRRFTIIGVGPSRFSGTEPLSPDVWVTTRVQQTILPPADLLVDRSSAWLLAVGRLKPAVSRPAAAAGLTVTAGQLAAVFPGPDRPAAIAVVRGTFFTIDSGLWPVIILVLSTVALVLAIACANVGNLVLARTSARQRELATRLAIGATRSRIVRHLMAESAIISLAGGLVGLLLAYWTFEVLYPIGLSFVPSEWGAVVLDLSPDLQVFAYTFGIAISAGLLVGIVPAIQSSAPRITAALHDDGAIMGLGVRRSRLRNALVIVQVAVCLAVLIGAGLLARGLQHARALDVGFRTGGVIFMDYDLRRHAYTLERAREFNRTLEDAAMLSGGASAALTSHVPLHGGIKRTPAWPEGHADQVTCTTTTVSPSYFDVLNIAITRGRTFSASETHAGAPVVMISEGLASRFWPGLDPIGRRLDARSVSVSLTVVGVVRDASVGSIFREKELSLYLPQGLADERDLHVVARTAGDVHTIMSVLQLRAHAIDPGVRVTVTPLDALLRLWILPSKVAAGTAGVLGVLALLLAALGLYGVMAYAVAQRTREIGIRIALGARGDDVVRLVLLDGIRLLAIGVAIGLGGALVFGRLLRQFLFDVSSVDPLTFLLVPACLCGVALAACYIPARRASRLSPLDALRAP